MESNGENRLLKGWKLVVNQSLAMFQKKFLFNIRNYKIFIIQNLIPVVFLIITIFTVRNWMSTKTDPPPLKISLDTYVETFTVLQENTTLALYQEYATKYWEQFNNAPASQTLDRITNDFQGYILDKMNKTLPTVNSKYMVAASFTDNKITGWFNNQAFHTAPLTINLLNNAILKKYCPECEISITNAPLPISSDSRVSIFYYV